MKYIVFDIETTTAVGPGELTDMDISVVSLYSSETNSLMSFTVDEFKEMWKHFETADVVIGYNNDHFDMPILNKYYAGDLTQIRSIDILAEIKKSYGRRVKLDDIAKATLNHQKSGHGLQAVEWWEQGEIEKIKKYCEDDVKLTHDIYLFAKENKYLNLITFSGDKIKIEINTDDWETKENTGLTFSMGF